MKARRVLIGILIILLVLLILNGFSFQSLIDTVYSPNIKELKMNSPSIKKGMKVNVYIPPNYSTKKKYPVLYLLHGKDGNQNSWMYGFLGISAINIQQKADKLIKEHKIQPLIIVSPQIDNSYGVNSLYETKEYKDYSKGMYEDYIVHDLIPYIDKHFSTLTTRENRFIGGLSMGGFAALHIAFRHPDLFSKVGGHSPALRKDPASGTDISWLFPSQKEREERDPLYLAKNLKPGELKIYLDNGEKDHDWLIEGNEILVDTLKQKGIDVQYKESPGGHDYKYWSSQTKNYLMFYAGNH
ncbi:alpha/beta hydrolase [Neobacillus sp. Marseille-QA0830]